MCVRSHPLRWLLLAWGAQAAQRTASAQSPVGPAPHPLGAEVAHSTTTFSNITEVVQTTDGRIWVNDPTARQLWLLDGQLQSATVVLDSAAGHDRSYGPRAGRLFSYRGDSVFFVDQAASTYVVVGPSGPVRSMPFLSGVFDTQSMGPSSGLMASVYAAAAGMRSAFSPLFGVVASLDPPFDPARLVARLPRGDPTTIYRVDDSSQVLTMNVTTRRIDTVASLMTAVRLLTTAKGLTSSYADVVSIDDRIAVAPNGEVAILRNREFRVDWIGAGGTTRRGPRLPFPWQRIDDTAKARMVDSVNAARQAVYQDRVAAWRRDSISVMTRGVTIPGIATSRVPVVPARPRPVETIDLPDFMSPVAEGARTFLPDGDGRVWIKLRSLGSPGSVFDVVDGAGQLVDRVAVPAEWQIVGFGPGVAYVATHDGGKVQLHRVRI